MAGGRFGRDFPRISRPIIGLLTTSIGCRGDTLGTNTNVLDSHSYLLPRRPSYLLINAAPYLDTIKAAHTLISGRFGTQTPPSYTAPLSTGPIGSCPAGGI